MYMPVERLEESIGPLELQWNTTTKKQVGEKRVYLTYTSILLFTTERNQDRDSVLEAGVDAETMEGNLACSACFLIEPRTTRPGMTAPIMGWALPH